MGVFLGATVGGWAAIQFGWRGAFFLVAGVGLAAAALLVLLVREPVRGGLDRGYAAKPAAAMSLPASARLFLSKPTLRILLVASGLAAFVSTGMLNWIPAYLMRVQQMPLAEVARWFGPAAGLCMGVGIWGGGALVNWAGRRSPKAYAWIPGLSMLLTAPTLALACLAPSWQTSLALMCVPMICCTMYVAPALALVQNLSPVAARATATSLLLLAFNILGPGGGPLAIGMMSDGFAAAGAAQPLKLALIATAPIALVSALLYARLARVVDADTRKVLEET
ncbi:MFS transporter [Phenylobacterium sp. J426]|uniref:MFS transporter n=1 Tax=Phenylobacterium sp. J426 TaxID=2898439 RepID=UPI00215101FA|nr:MFS transporter [Phenylobacterium sp. J426]